jgi:hypothetical protein
MRRRVKKRLGLAVSGATWWVVVVVVDSAVPEVWMRQESFDELAVTCTCPRWGFVSVITQHAIR